MDLIKKAERFAKKWCDKDPEDPALFKNHVQLVRKYAVMLAGMEGADRTVCEIAALLHDTGKYAGRKGHHIRSKDLAERFLKDIELPREKKELILKCVFKHRSRFSEEENEIEVKVVQSADVLGVLFDDEWQEHSRKKVPPEELKQLLGKTMEKINLGSARKIALPQYERLLKILER